MKKLILIFLLLPIIIYNQTYNYDYSIREEWKINKFQTTDTDIFGGVIMYKDSVLIFISDYDTIPVTLKAYKINENTYTDNVIYEMTVYNTYIEFQFKKEVNKKKFTHRLIFFRKLE